MFLRSVILSFALMFAVASSAPVRADDAAVRAELVAQWRKMFEARDLAFSAVVSSTGRQTRGGGSVCFLRISAGAATVTSNQATRCAALGSPITPSTWPPA